jgi:DNA-directed RNA polymerase subunit M/transcription elongation factor TFIIS
MNLQEYAHLAIHGDFTYAVYASRKGESGRMAGTPESGDSRGDEVERRKREIRDTLRCPHCGERLNKWGVPQTVFTEWPNEFFYVCMNDECSYFVRGWAAMAAQGNSCSYRLMYDPLTDSCQPVPVSSANTLRDGIIEEE